MLRLSPRRAEEYEQRRQEERAAVAAAAEPAGDAPLPVFVMSLLLPGGPRSAGMRLLDLGRVTRYFQHTHVLPTQRPECERQGITRRARRGLPKAARVGDEAATTGRG